MRERPPRSLPRQLPGFVLQRAATQIGLLGAVLGVIVAGSVVLGTCALLLTAGQDEALATAMRHAVRADVEVTAAVHLTPPSAESRPDPTGVRADTMSTLAGAMHPYASETSVWLSSTMSFLPTDGGSNKLGYLEEGDGLVDHSRLVAGRWPASAQTTGPLEVAVLRSTAQDLGLAPGSTTELDTLPEQLAGNIPANEAGTSTTVVVVGVFTVAPGEIAAWARDPLEGAGFDQYSERHPAYGPFVVAPGTLLSLGVRIELISVVARPDLSDASPEGLDRVGSALAAARTDVTTVLGDRAKSVALFSSYPTTLAVAQTQHGVTGSGAVAVTLLGAGLAGTALALAGRLIAARRAAERALLSARGASRAQLVRHAAADAVVLATLGTAVTLPMALALYRMIVSLPQLAQAELAPLAAVTPALVLTVAAGAMALAVLLVAPTLRSPDRSGARRHRGGLVARSGADLIVAGVAVVGFFQLRAHRVATSASIDPVLVAAPVLCLLAGAILVLRVLPLVARLAEAHARRSRALTVPLAGWELARRPHATSGAFLLVLAAAVATFGLSFTQTWSGSQQDQADVEVGTDLAVNIAGTAPLAEGRALADATGATPTPVTAEPIGLGTRAGGGPMGVTRLVALDTTRAGALLRGRLPAGQTWADLTRGLAPEERSGGPLVAPADVLTLSISGAGADGTPLVVAPTLILQGSSGERVAVATSAVPLDGAPHALRVQLAPDDGPRADPALRLVAMQLNVDLGNDAEVSPELQRTTEVTVAVQLLGATIDADAGPAQWGAAAPVYADETSGVAATQAPGERGATVTASASVSLPALLYRTSELVVTAFPSSTELPIAVSAGLAESMDLLPGDTLNLSVYSSIIPAVIVRVVPYVPSAARNPGVLADHDALTRVMLSQGELPPVTDTWWVGDLPQAQAAAEVVQAQHLGEPVTRLGVAGDLRDGPLRAPLRAAMWLLVAAAVVLSLAGTAVHTAASVEARSVDVARLQGLGVPRRDVVRSILIQHGAVSVLAIAAGALVGALVAAAAGPLLVVSATGLTPVPEVLFVWPWLAQGTLLAALLLGSALVTAPVAVRIVRRATVTHLRMDAS